MLINGSLDGLIGVLNDGILEAANKFAIVNIFAVSVKAPNEIIELAEVESDVGAVSMLEGFKLLQGGVNITWRKSVIAIEEIAPCTPPIVFSTLPHLDESRATTS